MEKQIKHLPDLEATHALGCQFARAIQQILPGDHPWVIYLHGELGAGKTAFARSLISQLGYSGHVKSPTYTLVESYELPKFVVHHFDLYRIFDPRELEFIGIHDYFQANTLCLIEWAERAENNLPLPDLILNLSWEGEGRVVEILGKSTLGKSFLESMA